METCVKLVEDFPITGNGSNPEWDKIEWQFLNVLGNNGKYDYPTKFKMLWSRVGMYFLFDCEDNELTCTKEGDYLELYLEDVIEVFLWPDESQVIYFEYEISPLGYQLPLIVPNCNGKFHGWLPFLYDPDRRVISGTSVMGGEKKPMQRVKSWKVEFFVPFKLLVGLSNCPPLPGARWRANFCRLDYGDKQKTQWSWAVDDMEDNFHNYKKFGTIAFSGE